MPPYGSTTRGPLRTRKSVATGSPSAACANSNLARPAGRYASQTSRYACSVRIRKPARAAVSW